MALTKKEYFKLYTKVVSRETIEVRMNQLYSNLTPGLFKDTAEDRLRQDVRDALDAQIAAAEARIESAHDEASHMEATIRAQDIGPLQEERASVEEAELR